MNDGESCWIVDTMGNNRSLRASHAVEDISIKQ